MTATAPAVSIVIITKNDPDVRVTIDAVLAQAAASPRSAELIVVDASAQPVTIPSGGPVPAAVVPFRSEGPKATIPEQRNVAVAHSRGDVIAFIDSGCVPSPGWLDALLEPVITGGESIVAGSHRGAEQGAIRDRDAEFRHGEAYLREAPTINLAVRREVFGAIGGFDEGFGYGSDVDFTWRAVAGGFRVRHAPDAVVTHDWGPLGGDLKRSFTYGRARFQLYRKHADHRSRVLRDDPILVPYALFLLGLPLALRRRAYLLLTLVPMAKNARSQPLLTTAHNLAFGAGVLAGVGGLLRPAARSSDG
jgi:hypothetical protein